MEAAEKSRRRSRSTSQPAPPDLTLTGGKSQKRRWRRRLVTETDREEARPRQLTRPATMSYLGGDEEVTGSDAQGGSTDGGQLQQSADEDTELSDISFIQLASEKASDQACNGSEHEGQHVISLEVQVPVDQLFKMMFTRSEFLAAFYKKLKYYDAQFGDWKEQSDGVKTRNVKFQIDIAMKSSTVTEFQTLLPVSRPGSHYVVNSEVNNQGIPLCDVFYTNKHYCLKRVSGNACQLDAWCKTKFRKSTMFKSFIEKTANDGMEDHHSTLRRVLTEWLSGDGGAAKRKRKKRRTPGAGQETDGYVTEAAETRQPSSSGSSGSRLLPRLTLLLTLLLLLLNGWLYVRLSRLGHQTETMLKDDHIAARLQASPELLHDWLRAAQQQLEQQQQYRAELTRLQQAVMSAAELVRQSETALNQLHESLESSNAAPSASLKVAASSLETAAPSASLKVAATSLKTAAPSASLKVAASSLETAAPSASLKVAPSPLETAAPSASLKVAASSLETAAPAGRRGMQTRR